MRQKNEANTAVLHTIAGSCPRRAVSASRKRRLAVSGASHRAGKAAKLVVSHSFTRKAQLASDVLAKPRLHMGCSMQAALDSEVQGDILTMASMLVSGQFFYVCKRQTMMRDRGQFCLASWWGRVNYICRNADPLLT